MAVACNYAYASIVCANISKEPNPVPATEEQGPPDGGNKGFPSWQLYVWNTYKLIVSGHKAVLTVNKAENKSRK